MMKKIGLLLSLLLLTTGVTLAQGDENAEADWPEQYYTPYMLAGSLPLAYTMEQTGLRYYTLAFVLNGPQECQAAWGGIRSITASALLPDLEKLRAQGGDVIVSFGGAAGDELALICPDVASLTVQYQAVVKAYQVTRLDFDIEGDEMRDTESIARRSRAIAMLQAQALEAGQPIHVTFTLPVLPSGLTEAGLAVLQSALDHGVEIGMVNIMTMNYGSAYAPDMIGAHSIEAADSLFAQLVDLYPEKSESELWAMIGLTPMIGMNDTAGQVFTLDDARLLVDYALDKGIAMVAMWSFHRDKACPGNAAAIMNSCSGIAQEDFDFSTVFDRMNSLD